MAARASPRVEDGAASGDAPASARTPLGENLQSAHTEKEAAASEPPQLADGDAATAATAAERHSSLASNVAGMMYVTASQHACHVEGRLPCQ
mmetsp:Transcript_105074/g.302319  ORF Transcript_105074/g.302319 Transcript_105074/m.302319 type:complete len:92 (-) Transcript_105074:1-276(-)